MTGRERQFHLPLQGTELQVTEESIYATGENGNLKGKQGKINQKVKASERTMEQPQWGLRGEEQQSARDSTWEKIKDHLKQL